MPMGAIVPMGSYCFYYVSMYICPRFSSSFSFKFYIHLKDTDFGQYRVYQRQIFMCHCIWELYMEDTYCLSYCLSYSSRPILAMIRLFWSYCQFKRFRKHITHSKSMTKLSRYFISAKKSHFVFFAFYAIFQHF